MSEPQIILVPVAQGQNNGQPLQVGLAGSDQLPSMSQHPNNPSRQMSSQAGSKNYEHGAEDSSLVKQVTSNPSILYSFINWENPGKTFASLITIMSLIISTRYFSPLQWILKFLCIILGATSLTEAISRVATKDGLMASIRPQTYYRPSEGTYSRLSSEIREAVDITLVQLQRVVFAEDLQGSVVGFAITFAAYWLIKTIPPLWLAIITTILTYTLGPIFTGRHSANIKPIIDQKARNLKDSAVSTASSATNRTVNKTQELSSRAMDTASSATNQAANKTQDLTSRAMDTASSATNQAANKTQDLTSRAMDTASSTGDNIATKAQDFKDRTVDSAAHTTDYTTGTAQEFPNHTGETGYSTIGNKQTVGYGIGNRNAFSHEIATPSALGFDDIDTSGDRRTHVYPLAPEIKNRPI